MQNSVPASNYTNFLAKISEVKSLLPAMFRKKTSFELFLEGLQKKLSPISSYWYFFVGLVFFNFFWQEHLSTKQAIQLPPQIQESIVESPLSEDQKKDIDIDYTKYYNIYVHHKRQP